MSIFEYDAERESFGSYVRAARLRPPSRLSRRDLGMAANISEAYVKRIENENLIPSSQILRALADALLLNDHQRTHLFVLANYGGGRSVATEEVLELSVNDQGFINALPVPAAYLDTNWSILHANSAYDAVFPGLLREGNVLRWFFRAPESRQVMVDWEEEAALTVDWLRYRIAETGSSLSDELVNELFNYDDFERLWSQRDVAIYRRNDFMRVLSMCSGQIEHLNARLFPMSKVSTILCFIAARKADHLTAPVKDTQ